MGRRAAVQGWPFALAHAYAATMYQYPPILSNFFGRRRVGLAKLTKKIIVNNIHFPNTRSLIAECVEVPVSGVIRA